MTDEQLKSALIEVRDHMLTQFPVAEKDCGFSPKFHRKMRQLIEMEKHPLLYQMTSIQIQPSENLHQIQSCRSALRYS